jgi:hypothetical protein
MGISTYSPIWSFDVVEVLCRSLQFLKPLIIAFYPANSMIFDSFSGTAKISIALFLCSVVIVKYREVVVMTFWPRISLRVHKTPPFISKCEANAGHGTSCRLSLPFPTHYDTLSLIFIRFPGLGVFKHVPVAVSGDIVFEKQFTKRPIDRNPPYLLVLASWSITVMKLCSSLPLTHSRL